MSILMPDFDLNVTPGGMPPVLHMAQYDTGRTYVANLKGSDGPYNVSIGTTAKIKGRNAAGVCWEQDCTIDSSHLDQVTFTPEGAATDQFGIMPVQLELTDTNQEIVSTLIIIFDIQRAGYTNEEAASSPEFETAMETAAAAAIGSTAVLKRDQAEKTSAMTQPVGIAEDGTLWVPPGGGGGIGKYVVTLSAQGVPDKSSSEIYAAWQAGYIVQLRSSGGVEYALQNISNTRAIFATAIDAGTHIQLDSYTIQGTAATHNTLNGYIKPGSGIPQTDLAVYTTTITNTGSGYTADNSLPDILAANAAGKLLTFMFDGMDCHVDEVSSSVVRVHVVDEATAGQPTLYTFIITGTGVTGNETAISGSGSYPPSSGIPLADLAQNVQTAIGLSQKAVVTYIAQTSSVDVAPPYIQSALLAGYKIVLQEVSMGDYEIPLSFVNSTGTTAVFSAIIRDYSTGDAKAVIYYVDDQRQTTKTVTPVGGSADAVTYTAQTGKTDSEKAQARTNIGASAEPSVVTVTGNTPSITPADNTIYDCTGDAITSVTVSSYSYGVSFTLMFNVQPNSSPTITIDSKITFPDGFAFEANRSYEINVNGKGRAVIGAWMLVD